MKKLILSIVPREFSCHFSNWFFSFHGISSWVFLFLCLYFTVKENLSFQVGREVGGGIGMGNTFNPWLIHVNVWQKPLQYCKVISLWLIKINGKKIYLKSWFLTASLTWLTWEQWWYFISLIFRLKGYMFLLPTAIMLSIFAILICLTILFLVVFKTFVQNIPLLQYMLLYHQCV